MVAEELDSLDHAIERQKNEERLMAQRMILPEEERQPLPGIEPDKSQVTRDKI